jgi:predicted transcriptional regulator
MNYGSKKKYERLDFEAGMRIRAELKQIIAEKGADRRKIAEELQISPMYINSMLNGWAPIPLARAEQIRAIVCRSAR